MNNQQIKLVVYRLQLAQATRRAESPPLRDFVGPQLEQELLCFNRGPNDQLVFQYPRVQCKVVERFVYVLAINEAADLLTRDQVEVDHLASDTQAMEIVETKLETSLETVAVTSEPIRYRFVTPWLALNHKNFQEFTRSKSQAFRREKLDRTLAGNCLGMCKSLGIRLQGRFSPDCSALHSIKTSVRGKPTIGFLGTVTLNLQLPDYIGLGRSVDSGFGTLEKVP